MGGFQLAVPLQRKELAAVLADLHATDRDAAFHLSVLDGNRDDWPVDRIIDDIHVGDMSQVTEITDAILQTL